MRASDVPAGWTRQPKASSSDSSSDKTLNALAAKCGTSKKAFKAFKKFETARASSDWASADNSQLSDQAQLYTTKKVADKAWGLVSECLLDGFIAYLDKQMQSNAPAGGRSRPARPARSTRASPAWPPRVGRRP